MAGDNGITSFGVELSVSKIPKPGPASTVVLGKRSRTPQKVPVSEMPSRIPPAATTPRRSREEHSCNVSAQFPQRSTTPSQRSATPRQRSVTPRQRSLTPPPSSKPQDADLASLKVRCAERLQHRLQDPRARAQSSVGALSEQISTVKNTPRCSVRPHPVGTSEIPVLKQRVEPGRIMARPPGHSRSAAGCPDSGSSLHRSVSARTIPARNSTPPPSACPTLKPTANRGSTTKAGHTTPRRDTVSEAASTAGRPLAASVESSARFSPPERRAPAAALGKPKAVASRAVRKAGRLSTATLERTEAIDIFNVATPMTGGGAGLNASSPPPSAWPGSNSSVRPSGAGHGETMNPKVLEQILQENRQLRDAFSQATLRIAALEDGQHRFFDEGIFDLVNAVHTVPTQPSTAATSAECSLMDVSEADVPLECWTAMQDGLAADNSFTLGGNALLQGDVHEQDWL